VPPLALVVWSSRPVGPVMARRCRCRTWYLQRARCSVSRSRSVRSSGRNRSATSQKAANSARWRRDSCCRRREENGTSGWPLCSTRSSVLRSGYQRARSRMLGIQRAQRRRADGREVSRWVWRQRSSRSRWSMGSAARARDPKRSARPEIRTSGMCRFTAHSEVVVVAPLLLSE